MHEFGHINAHFYLDVFVLVRINVHVNVHTNGQIEFFSNFPITFI